MNKFLIAALITLFVAVMPLHAAFAEDTSTEQACQTNMTLNELLAKAAKGAAENNGKFTHVSAQSDVDRFRRNIEKVAGPAPFEFNSFIITMVEDSSVAYVFFFKDQCFLDRGQVSIEQLPDMLTKEEPSL